MPAATAGDFPEVLTIDQACNFLQIGKTLLYKEARAGRIPGRQIGTVKRAVWRFHIDELRAWLRGKAVNIPPQVLPTDADGNELTRAEEIADMMNRSAASKKDKIPPAEA